MHSRHHELKDVPRVKISAPNTAKFHLRTQHKPEGMATLQAIAHALGVIEGEFVKAQLMNVYDMKVRQALLGRGRFAEESAEFKFENRNQKIELSDSQ